MTNPNFVNPITFQQQKGTDQAWVKRALEAFPNADSLRTIEGPWDREIPRIRDDELTPASEIQSGASSVSSLSDTSIVVSGGSSELRRRKRRRNGSSSRTRPPSASSPAPSSSVPWTSRSARHHLPHRPWAIRAPQPQVLTANNTSAPNPRIRIRAT
ncbi:hypothetical protein FNYG_07747 [Fusarium nygamai]|uniref:Uncharacterized protein n=1 Tax=Gibberella nygamai TaxID=42673 RepID=A0A2K0W9C7_GIBNY|nr:hypothetical protein FNYG_07747 [Fusarium nygamai]